MNENENKEVMVEEETKSSKKKRHRVLGKSIQYGQEGC